MRTTVVVLLLALVLSLAACGGGDASPAGGSGDAANGEKVFAEVAAPACNTCHSLEPGVNLVGPSLAGMGSAAGSRVSGESADEYLRKSVVEPGAFVVEGYAEGLMPSTYTSQLTAEQVDDLVAYMLTLK